MRIYIDYAACLDQTIRVKGYHLLGKGKGSMLFLVEALAFSGGVVGIQEILSNLLGVRTKRSENDRMG